MPSPFEAVKLTDRVYWVGAIDWEIRNFHGYATDRGTTYNAYLVLGEKNILVDTVKAPFHDELMARISSVVDPEKIDVLVSNHSEMDHTGCLPRVLRETRPERIIASAMGEKALRAHFTDLPEIEVAKDGGRIEIGDVHLTFLETRMLHWPDSTFSYLEEEKILFSQDAFGMHLASTERYDDEIDDGVLYYEAAKYYANILMPYSPLVAKLLAKVKEMSLPCDLIAPDHGPIWRSDFGRICEHYERWSAQPMTGKAVIVYDTMWHSTEAMAHSISDGLSAKGISVNVVPLQSATRADLATATLEAGALLVGTPTLNNEMFPTLADALVYLKGLKPRNLIGAAFGSYGWSGEGVKRANAALEAMGVELVHDGLKVQYVPEDDDLVACREFGGEIGDELAKRVAASEEATK